MLHRFQHQPKSVANIVFSALPYTKTIDPMWADEYEYAKAIGLGVCLYSSEDEKLHYEKDGEWHVTTPASRFSERMRGYTLYRGWMLTFKEYHKLSGMNNMIVPVDEYISSHECYGWVDQIPTYTFRTEYHPAPLSGLTFDKGQRYFVKGASKSFGDLSFINSVEDVIRLLTSERIADGDTLCVRDYIELSKQPESRFFVVRGEAIGSKGTSLPESLTDALKELKPRTLYSLDVAYTLDGTPIIVEIGDAQVSDLKEWTVKDFYDTVVNRIEIKTNSFAEIW